jgi:uncharacterized NAD-dependent epimerase/dehydratase family protein
MATDISATWEVGITGTPVDYSPQDAGIEITSVAGGFTAAVVGNVVYITAEDYDVVCGKAGTYCWG